MKNKLNFKHVIYLFGIISCIVILQSCAVYTPYSYTPVTLSDVVKMSKDSLSSRHIINEIKKSHTAYEMKASEYAKLQKAGVADSVLNFMQKTHENLIRRDQQMQDSYYGYSGYGYGNPGFGWPYSYWGWNMGPTVIFRGGGRGFHGGDRDRR